ncbi:MAG: FAS1-like dehydratase domain-containing protein [Paracoccaceae bacterium]
MKDQIVENYVGRNLSETGAISAQRCSEIFATFGWQGETTVGSVLPQLCHWCAFSPVVSTDELGEDGHPGKGAFLPDLGLERRMWASGRLEFLQDLHVGEVLTRSATIEKVDIKEGTSGKMAFVTVAHEVSGQNGLAIRESQSIVYLAMPKSFEPPAKRPMPQDKVFEHRYAMPTTRLFRFSAITFNAHRIHFDLPYAQEVEKYPGLVVHGPMQAMLLAKASTDHAQKALTQFSFRGVHPCFHFDDLALCAEATADGDGLNLFAGVPGGHQTMQAKANW